MSRPEGDQTLSAKVESQSSPDAGGDVTILLSGLHAHLLRKISYPFVW